MQILLLLVSCNGSAHSTQAEDRLLCKLRIIPTAGGSFRASDANHIYDLEEELALVLKGVITALDARFREMVEWSVLGSCQKRMSQATLAGLPDVLVRSVGLPSLSKDILYANLLKSIVSRI